MSDQAAGLRAWQQQRDSWPLLILGEPDPGALSRVLESLGGSWRPVTLDQADSGAPAHALLWVEAAPVDATADYRWLKRMTVSAGPLPTLLRGERLESAARERQLDNLGVAAWRFLGVALHREVSAWQSEAVAAGRRRG
ncbi:hypothetical protein [Salinicola aestuarinus]|uniref:hypothetical protein n=1 Tax=Salinicola aestuarinus TaxID=1949082 RepID=UPI000DA1C044|nr:hypothetical protein [Salinicola aestuarinus]